MYVSKMHLRGRIRRKNYGFTVIEIIAAIIILGILASLSVNLMSDYKIRQKVDSARQQFVNAITIATASAAKFNTTYTVRFDSTTREIRVCPESATNCNNDNAEFYANLTLFERSCPSTTATGCDLSGDLVSVTPFGHIDADHMEMYFIDSSRRVISESGSGVCMGIKMLANGSVELTEVSATNSTCPAFSGS